MISEEAKQELANLIINNLKKDFDFIYLSHNLADTIYLEETENGLQIHIPAKMYDLGLYEKERVIKYTGKGSYANEVELYGGFSGKHRNYVLRAINDAIRVWTNSQNINLERIDYL